MQKDEYNPEFDLDTANPIDVKFALSLTLIVIVGVLIIFGKDLLIFGLMISFYFLGYCFTYIFTISFLNFLIPEKFL